MYKKTLVISISLLLMIITFCCCNKYYAAATNSIDSSIVYTQKEVSRDETNALKTFFVSIINNLKTVVNRHDLRVTDIEIEMSDAKLSTADKLSDYLHINFSPQNPFNTDVTIEWYKIIKDTNRKASTEVSYYSSGNKIPNKNGKYLLVVSSKDGQYKDSQKITVSEINSTIYYVINGQTVNITNTAKPGYLPCTCLTNALGSRKSAITKVVFEQPIYLLSYENFFANMTALTTIDNIQNLHTDFATNLDCMFFYCKSLEALDTSKFILTRAEDIGGIFACCQKLKFIDVSNWNVSKVEIAGNAFCGCESLETLDVSKWDTHNMWTTYSMFANCINLKNVNISDWNMNKNQELAQMFSYCNSLSRIDLSKWSTPDLKYVFGMFENCTNLTYVDVSGINLSQCTDLNGMFTNIGQNKPSTSVSIIGLDKWDTSNITDFSRMFLGAKQNARSGNISNKSFEGIKDWDTHNAIDMTCMFYGQGKGLKTLDISEWDVSNCTSFNHMFCDCSSLIELDLSKWNVQNVKTVNNMFDDCYALTTIGDISNWNTANLIDCACMFDHCSAFHANGIIDLSNWNTESLITCGAMFAYGQAREIDLSSWTTESLSNSFWPGSGEGIFYETGNCTATYQYNTTTKTNEIIRKQNNESIGMIFMFRNNPNLQIVKVGSNWVYTGKFYTTNMWVNTSIGSVSYI